MQTQYEINNALSIIAAESSKKAAILGSPVILGAASAVITYNYSSPKVGCVSFLLALLAFYIGGSVGDLFDQAYIKYASPNSELGRAKETVENGIICGDIRVEKRVTCGNTEEWTIGNSKRSIHITPSPSVRRHTLRYWQTEFLKAQTIRNLQEEVRQLRKELPGPS